jgi:hypothetical protein
MSDVQELINVDWPLFVALVLPGFVSMRVYAMIHPVDHTPLKDSLLEAIALGILNAAVLWWAIALLLTSTNFWTQYVLILLIFVIAPAIWPFAIDFAMKMASRTGLILPRAKTAWDNYFLRRERCWIIAHLKDGRRIGGYFGDQSYATLHPQSGHLYIEQLWEIDQDTGEFGDAVLASRGLLLRPEDYHFVELKSVSWSKE